MVRPGRLFGMILPHHCGLIDLFLIVGLICGIPCRVANSKAPDFRDEIEPILEQNCIDCHGQHAQESGFRVDRLSALLKGGDSGEPAIVPGDPDASYLIKRISTGDHEERMPPDDELSSHQIQLLRQWVAAGAPTPERLGPAQESVTTSHWSFQPLSSSPLPGTVDHFIDSALEQNGLARSASASRRQLIRRLYLIMHGLPPSPDQVAEFLGDSEPDAWGRLVNRALSSPRYGETFASLWLDLVRFGETDGFETNRERPSAWRYRDWVIQSLNQDKPYDSFIREQIAGDGLGEPLGTGFLVAGPHDIVKSQDKKLTQMQRMNELDDMIGATGTTFLGLTTGCARCHNHKFDPISQRDYYAMQAVFAGVHHGQQDIGLPEEYQRERDRVDERLAQLKNKLSAFQPSALDDPVNARRNVETFAPRRARWIRMTIHATNGGEPCIDEFEIFFEEQNQALASRGARVTSSGDFEHPYHRLAHINDGIYGNQNSWIAAQQSGAWIQFELPEETWIHRIEWGRDREGQYADRLPIDYEIETAQEPGVWQSLATSSSRQPFEKSSEPLVSFDGLPEDQANMGRQWLAEINELTSYREQLSALSNAWTGIFKPPPETRRLYRGEPEYPRELVAPGALEVLTSLKLDADAPEIRRRLTLADWLASAENPLTARVMVNRIWQFHFGTGLVDTPNDFGQNGSHPSHPELLDWLAGQLVQSGWSLKHVHRLILLSETWQQDSRPRSECVDRDADCRLIWRFPPRRLPAEGIRDSILAVSGSLDASSVGGPGFSAFEVEMENVRHYHPIREFGPDQWRRMVYMTRVRQEKDDCFGVFDCPDGSLGIAVRGRSTTPLQALNLLNSRFVTQQAQLFSERLEREVEMCADRIRWTWELCFQRLPTESEMEMSVSFIERSGLQEFARAMFNTNEFLFIP
jgi:hypothetical protein